MTKRELERYFWLQHEIKQQWRRLARLKKKREKSGELVGDSVKDYRSGKGLPLKIQGIAQEDFTTPIKIKILEEAIEKNIKESETVIIEIENYIQGLDDPRIRELLRSRYIDCLSWEKVGKENFISEQYARELVREHLKKM